MRTDETLLLHALKLKQMITKGSSGPDSLLDRVLESNPEEAKKSMRNICAFISPKLFDDINMVSNFLDLSKRQIVEMALLDFMEKADKVINDVDPFPDGIEPLSIQKVA